MRSLDIIAIGFGVWFALLLLAWLLSEAFIRFRHRQRQRFVPSGDGVLRAPTRKELKQARKFHKSTEDQGE